jgi:hypothetical protein
MLIGQIAPQERQLRLAPFRNVLVVVTVRHGSTDGQQQDLRQRMPHPPHVARVPDPGEVVQKRPKARLLVNTASAKLMAAAPRINPPLQRITKMAIPVPPLT